MNKKGQAMLIFGIMIFVFVFILAVVMTSPLKDFTDTARDSAHLDCDNSSIATGIQLTCVVIDLTLPLFIVTLLTAGTGFLVLDRRQ